VYVQPVKEERAHARMRRPGAASRDAVLPRLTTTRLCGSARQSFASIAVRRLEHLPVWAVHGSQPKKREVHTTAHTCTADEGYPGTARHATLASLRCGDFVRVRSAACPAFHWKVGGPLRHTCTHSYCPCPTFHWNVGGPPGAVALRGLRACAPWDAMAWRAACTPAKGRVARRWGQVFLIASVVSTQKRDAHTPICGLFDRGYGIIDTW
jgi:hypothetical protein